MAGTVHIQLLPLAKTLIAPKGALLQDLLFTQGVEFPCGGRGRCRGCRIKVLEGSLPPTPEDQRLLSSADIAAGWRLGCRARAEGNLTLELAQWEATILADDTPFAFTPREGLGIAIDVGSTTLVAQLLDLAKGMVLAVGTALNAQARYGADIVNRIEYAIGGGNGNLQKMVREQTGSMIEQLLASAGRERSEVKDVVLVGNTVMHHLFCGISVEPLARYPFQPEQIGLQTFAARELGWDLGASARFLPCLGGYVGSDILAGVLATKLHESDAPAALIDLGTNGEIVVGNRERMLCASTAAGPAFEGARISRGMRAATGAISEVTLREGRLHCHVLGNVEPRGICGSGLVDAIAAGLDAGWIQKTGRFAHIDTLKLLFPVALTQKDVRELQLAKGAIAAGFRILLKQWGATADELARVYLAGAFGNYINRASARRIGLLNFPPEKVAPVGNSALLGAKMALFDLAKSDGAYSEVRKRLQHVSLDEDPQFQDIFVDEMAFPD